MLSFQREDVAITLEVTPRINSSNMVTLEARPSRSRRSRRTTASRRRSAAARGGPADLTSQRQVETVVLVGDNQTDGAGRAGRATTDGAMSRPSSPCWATCRCIGALFRVETVEVTDRKSNLMIFLTPHIIDDPEDILEVQTRQGGPAPGVPASVLRAARGTSSSRSCRSCCATAINYVDEPSDLARSDRGDPGPAAVRRDPRGAAGRSSPDARKRADPSEGACELTDGGARADQRRWTLPEDATSEEEGALMAPPPEAPIETPEGDE